MAVNVGEISLDIQFETNKFMKHTIVISLYNTEAFIFDAITSLAFQEKKPSQIIIVDDCSTDKSLFRLKEALSFFAPQFLLTDIQIIELKENKGSGNARNIGLERANGDLISFLDADDYYTYYCLAEVSAVMQRENIVVLILGILLVPSENYLPNIKSFEAELDFVSNGLFLIPNALHTIFSSDLIIGSNVVIQRKHLKNFRFEINNSFGGKINFWFRVLKNLDKNNRVGLLNKACVEIREVKENDSFTSF